MILVGDFGGTVELTPLDLPSQLVLSTLNSSKTSYAQFTFSENFFESYEVQMATKKGVTCHLNAKVSHRRLCAHAQEEGNARAHHLFLLLLLFPLQALLGVFRSRGSLEKTAERCDISLYDSDAKKASRKKDKDRKGKKRRKVTDSDEEEEGEGSDNASSSSRSPSPTVRPPPSRLNIKFLCNNGSPSSFSSLLVDLSPPSPPRASR